MDPATFEKLLKSSNLNFPVYIFSGPENFLKEKAFREMSRTLVTKEEQQDNVNRIVLNGKDYPDAINRIFSFSFGSSPRLFFLQEIEGLNAKQRKDFLDKIDRGGIPASTYLIFSVNDNRVATELASRFKQQSEKIDYWTPFANQMPAWVRNSIKELGADMSNEAADLLLELTGPDLSIVYQELEKLAIANKGKRIEYQQIKSNVSYIKKDNIFDFLEAFGRRCTAKSLRCIEGLTSRGEAPQKIWFMLCRQLREYRLFHEISADRPDLMEAITTLLKNYRLIADKSDFKANQGKKSLISEIQSEAAKMPETLATSLGIKNPAKIRNMYLVLNFDRPELTGMWPLLIEADLTMKSGCPDAKGALQNLVAGILTNKTA